MIRILLGLFLVYMSACGGAYTVSIDPIKVDMTHNVTFKDILVAFKVECKKELGTNADAFDIEECVQLKLAKFINNLSDGLSAI